jgi:hypothetical protein
MNLSPSKVKVSMSEIPEDSGNVEKTGKKVAGKKADPKLEEFMRIYGL